MSHAQLAMLVTGSVLALAFALFWGWVSSESRGRDYRSWHRRIVALLGTAAGVVFIATAWMP